MQYRRRLTKNEITARIPALYSGTVLNPQKPTEEEAAKATRQLELISAVQQGHIERIDHWLDQGADIDHLDRENNAPLHYAVDKGDMRVVEHLVTRGADINLQGPRKSTPLHICADKQNTDMARFFIRKGAKMTLRDEWGLSVPDRAAISRHKDMARFLREEPSLLQARRMKQLYARRHRPGH